VNVPLTVSTRGGLSALEARSAPTHEYESCIRALRQVALLSWECYTERAKAWRRCTGRRLSGDGVQAAHECRPMRIERPTLTSTEASVRM
jgi:hypothetical protein